MKVAQTLLTFATLCLLSPTIMADDAFRPLDTRTRCIVLFRECLVLIYNKDVNGIFKLVADGGGTDFRLTPDPDALSPKLKKEIQDVNRFISRNFRTEPFMNRGFNKIKFSDLVTEKNTVLVTNAADNQKIEAKLHSIKIKIRIEDTDRDETVRLRFLQTADKIYWIPIGW